MIDWQNLIVSSIMFDWAWQSNYCMLFELVGFPSVRLDISYILIHCSTSQDAVCQQMFLKYIRDNILSMHFIALSSSMKTSLSEFFFSSWILRGSFFCFVFDSLILKNFNSWIFRFFFLIHCCRNTFIVCCVVWIELKARAERVTKRMTAIRSKFRSTLGNKESVKK